MFFFDKIIFTILESVTHRIQKLCGLDNFFWAKVSGVVFVVCVFHTFMHTVLHSDRQGSISLEEQKMFLQILEITYMPVALLFSIGSIVVVTQVAQTVYRDQLKGLSNRWKVNPDYIWIRFSIWVTLGFLTFSLLGDFSAHPKWILEDLRQTPLAPYVIVAVICWIYLVCCDPLPQAPSWFREKWDAWIAKKRPVLAEASN